MGDVKLTIKGAELKGLQQAKEVLEKYSKAHVKVGVFGGNHSSNGESLAKIATEHEFGSITPKTFNYKGKQIKINGLPTRSWLRMPLKLKKSQLKGKGYEGKEFFKQVIIKELENGYTGVALKFLGKNAEGIIDDAFATEGFGQWKKNISPEYIELKGSDTPLIDSGELRRSVSSQVVDGR